MNAATFQEDLAFLKQHTDVVTLSGADGKAKVAIVPAYQGRVMTSTATGDDGMSYGWINRDLIASGERQEHINAFGGEDRFLLGPEGGQYSIFFDKGVPFDLAHWFTPAPIDTDAYEIVSQGEDAVAFRHRFSLTNYSGTRFDVRADRRVQLLSEEQAWREVQSEPDPQIHVVAFQSVNKITNAGRRPWTKEGGLLSVWVLGMFSPSPATTVVVPIQAGPESALGKRVTSDYFGEIPPERLVVKEDVIFFSGDGQYRSKIGIGPERSKAILGSYDAANHVLTIVQFSQPAEAEAYVNSLWKLQENPYEGDAANSYNDGPPEPGANPLGPFYELESSSPAAALDPGESLQHVHRTIHLIGPETKLDPIARRNFGVSLQEIRNALPTSAAAAER